MILLIFSLAKPRDLSLRPNRSDSTANLEGSFSSAVRKMF